jgi:hypothetical protein
MAFFLRSIIWIAARRSLKNRSAARVADEFFTPKICTFAIKKPGAIARPGPISLLRNAVYWGRIQMSSSTCTEDVNVLSPTVRRTI